MKEMEVKKLNNEFNTKMDNTRIVRKKNHALCVDYKYNIYFNQDGSFREYFKCCYAGSNKRCIFQIPQNTSGA